MNVERVIPFYPIPIDVVQNHVCRHLTVYDLVVLMKCSKACLEYFRSDRAFAHIRARIEHHIPPFRKIFNHHLEPDAAKKLVIRPTKSAKKEMATPHKCIWYIIKTYLFPLTHWSGIKQLARGLPATDTVLRYGLLWGICENIEKCEASSENGVGSLCIYNYVFRAGSCYIRVDTNYMKINAYFKNSFNDILTCHTKHDVMKRCLGLFMGLEWPVIHSIRLGNLTGRFTNDVQLDEEPPSFEVDYNEDESYSE